MDSNKQNEIRRAAKSRQHRQAKAKALTREKGAEMSLFDAVREDQREARQRQRNREYAQRKSVENGQKLLSEVKRQGVLVLGSNSLNFNRDVLDLKTAAKKDKQRFHWEFDEHGNFRIAVIKHNAA